MDSISQLGLRTRRCSIRHQKKHDFSATEPSSRGDTEMHLRDANATALPPSTCHQGNTVSQHLFCAPSRTIVSLTGRRHSASRQSKYAQYITASVAVRHLAPRLSPIAEMAYNLKKLTLGRIEVRRILMPQAQRYHSLNTISRIERLLTKHRG